MSNEVIRASHVPAHFIEDLDQAYVQRHTPPPASPVQVHGGTVRQTAGQDPVEFGGAAKYTASQDGTAGGSIAATLGRRGTAQTVELIPGRPESRSDVRTAERMGLIRRDYSGNYVDVDGMAEAVAQVDAPEAPQDFEPAESLAFDAADDAAFNEAIAGVPQPVFEHGIAAVVAAMSTGKGLDGVASRMAEAAGGGMEPAAAAQLIDKAQAYYGAAASRALSNIGMTEDQQQAFYGALMQTPDKWTEAVQELVYLRSPAKLVEAAGRWRGANPPDLSGYEAAGYETHVDRRTGEVMLRMRGEGREWVKLSDLIGTPKPAPVKPSQAGQFGAWESVPPMTAHEVARLEAQGHQVMQDPAGRWAQVRRRVG